MKSPECFDTSKNYKRGWRDSFDGKFIFYTDGEFRWLLRTQVKISRLVEPSYKPRMVWSKRQRILGFYGLCSLTKSMNSRLLKAHASKEIDAENDTQGCPLSTIHTIHKLSTYIYTHKHI